jgi:DNA-binding transcriptional LysR family regulator
VELRHLRSFVTVASCLSMSAAARQLNLAQPAVSQHIRALESELGVLLFFRTKRGVRLTETGVALLGRARSLLEAEADLRASVARLTGAARAEVQLAAVASAAQGLLPRAFLLLGQSNDPPTVRLFERPTTDSLGLLAGRIVELAIVRDCGDYPGFEFEELLTEPLEVAIGPRCPAEDLKALKEAPFIVFDRAPAFLHRAAIEACSLAGFVPRTLCEGAEVGSMGAMIGAGVGFAIVPRSIVRMWAPYAVRSLPVPAPIPRSSLLVATLPGNGLSAAAARVVRSIRRVAASAE